MQQLVFLLSTLLFLAAVPSAYTQEGCSQAQSCDECLSNQSACVWRTCGDGQGSCVVKEANPNGNCSYFDMCKGIEVVAVASADAYGDVAEVVAVEEIDEDSGQNQNQGKDQPALSQAKFDMSSFIGGIILVLCVQAGGFFAMRFLKTKEQSSYDTIEQTQ